MCQQQLEKALVTELQGLQRIHIAVANQITRLKVSEEITSCRVMRFVSALSYMLVNFNVAIVKFPSAV